MRVIVYNIQCVAEMSGATAALTCKSRHGPSRQGHPERWPSGLRRTLGKRVCGKLYRGFESHSLRQIAEDPAVVESRPIANQASYLHSSGCIWRGSAAKRE